MAKKKLLDFSRVGKSATKTNIRTVGKIVGGGLIGEMLPSIFQRVTGIQAGGVAGNAVSGAVSTVLLLAMNQKEMAAGVVATKTIKAIITYGNPVAVKLTSVPIALPSTNDGYTVNLNPSGSNQLNPNMAQSLSPGVGTHDFMGMGDDIPAGGIRTLRLPDGRPIQVMPRDENPVVNFDTGGRGADTLSEYMNEQALANLKDRYSDDPVAALSDGVLDETMGM